MAAPTTKILILNSDSPNNRGDRAILLGGISLVRERFSAAELWAVSEHAERDAAWFGIDFLPMGVHTTNPLDLARLARFARTCSFVLWGGGELLKDYTNKLGLIYWVVKLLIVRLGNPHLYGFCQGIGPTSSSLSRRLITFVVDRTRHFLVRDGESARKLRTWGVRTPVTSTFDPAIRCKPQPLNDSEITQLLHDFDVDPRFLERAIGIGPRRWFHYKPGRWIPFRFLGRFGAVPGRTHATQMYIAHLATVCDRLIEDNDVGIIFFPMHVSQDEDDAGFSQEVLQRMKHSSRARILDQDSLSPQTFHNAIGACKAFVGFRLHSYILATTAHVPALVYYYVDKGRLYADQIGMSEFSRPIEDWLSASVVDETLAAVKTLLTDGEAIGRRVDQRLEAMRHELLQTFLRVPLERNTGSRLPP